jgi:VWFA-related protein
MLSVKPSCKRLTAAVALAALSHFAWAQTEAPAQQETPSFRAESTLVLVPTLVKDKSGKPVFTLKADDFTVTDNGAEQKITLEDDTDAQPLALVVALETGGGGTHQLDLYRNLEPLIEGLVGNVPHTVALVEFDSDVRLLHGFTSEWSEVTATLQSLYPGDKGAAILDGVGFSVGLLRKQPPTYRRAILLLSETIDHGSQAGLAETVRSISDTNTIIYSLAFSSTKSEFKREAPRILNDDRPGPPHGCMGKDPADPDQNKLIQAWNCLGLLVPPLKAAQLVVKLGMDGLKSNAPESISRLTGGEYYKFNNDHSLEKGLVTISNHVPNRYVLSFRPQSPAQGPHVLDVRLKEYPDLEITARKTYWVDSGDSGPPSQ